MNESPRSEGPTMTFSLDTPRSATLKSEAKALRDERARAGTPLGQGARARGNRPAGTAIATGTPPARRCPNASSSRCRSASASRAPISASPSPGMLHRRAAAVRHAPLRGDREVRQAGQLSASSSSMVPILRQRVRATVDVHGVSPSRTTRRRTAYAHPRANMTWNICVASGAGCLPSSNADIGSILPAARYNRTRRST